MKVDESQLRQEFKQLEKQLAQPDVYQADDYPQQAKRFKHLQTLIQLFDQRRLNRRQLKEAQALSNDEDSNLAALATTEVADLEIKLTKLEQAIKQLCQNSETDQPQDCIMEIRAGVGGSEASLFAADLYRMYSRFADKKGYQLELISQNASEVGGFKEIIFEINGADAYRTLELESGVHRVQRIPTTESQGRIHTSTASVAVLAKASEVEVKLEPTEIRIDTYRSSGHGGQSVNTTDSAVRITHLPTGLIVTCQDEKSQLKNKTKALSILRARLYQKRCDEQHSDVSSKRKQLIGRAMRNEKIRTYNFPQNRLTDHRINYSLYNLTSVLNGSLDGLLDKLAAIK